MTLPHQACIDACYRCAAACEHCLAQMIGEKSDNDCPHCCRECLAICLLCAQSLAHEGKFHQEICRLCANICDWCAEQCEAHDHDHCQACARACRECAEECRKVAA